MRRDVRPMQRSGTVLAMLGLILLAAMFAPEPAAAQSGTVAFAKASPLLVFESPALTGGRKEDFEFGKPYEVTEQTPDYVKIKLRDDRPVYVRPAHVTTMGAPRWLASTSGYNRTERPRIRMWESGVRLNQFISGINVAGSQWDYEEYFETAPGFALKLPIVETDTLDLLGGTRQVRLISVILPVSGQMYQAFEAAKAGSEKAIDLHLLADMSGSTKGFIEPVLGNVVKALTRNEQLRKRLRTITVTTFGTSRTDRSSFLGRFSVKDIEGVKWDRSGVDQTTSGDREPLIDGLVAMNSGLSAKSDAAPVLLILSGADVELASYVRAQGRQVAIENLELALPGDATAIFAQITPEPGDDLRNASRRLRNISRIRYLEYSSSLADDVVSELMHTAEGEKSAGLAVETFRPVVKAANDKRMMAFLPRVLTSNSSLPVRQSYAAQSDWYTVRLWLTLDELLWKEVAQ